MKYCTKCGVPVNDDVKFCNKCGARISGLQQEKADINKDNELTNENNESLKEKIEDKISLSKEHEEKCNKKDNNENSDSVQGEKLADNLEDTMTMEIPREEDYSERDYEDDNSDYDYNNRHVESHNRAERKSIFKSIGFKIFMGVFIAAIIVCGVFSNKIRGSYYIMKCRDSYIEQEKLDYAVKAVQSLENDESKELLKNTLIDMSKNDLSQAEAKLNEISGLLTESDYKNISIKIKEKKIDKLCSSSKYDEAFSEFSELDKLGEDYRKNEHYDDVMLNIAAKLTGTSMKNNKSDLMEDNNITYDDFDGDNYDEIVQVKDSSGHNRTDVKIILYKCQDGKYKQSDTNTLDSCANSELQGVYDYAENCKGVYVGYSNYIGNVGATSVFSVKDGKLINKGTVAGKNVTRPEDINNDGIYEIKSTTISYAASRAKEITKWYEIHEDGSMPTEVSKSSDGGASTDSDDYIFPDSDKTYLSDDQLRALSKDELALARNEIFARHGYPFKEEPFKSYFSQKSWYTINPSYDGSDSALNQYEIANYKAIQYWENR
ncbi:YARHG domain-containing protein [uncultured Clostridium sp.]|uniref:YARHG domain-containing protein n=1 Tax=uncultured Clostridium sp. TaxID=59620 RepID=UPI0025EB8E03|nr:YARHG domain-containing protein [uncultured Clostridium sp.]